MANLGQTFDSTQVNPDTGFDPLPAGDYIAMIIDSAMKPTKNGAGQYLELTLQVVDGPYAQRLLWDRLMLDHPNNKTVEIAQRKLSAICHAVNVLKVQDSTQLHNIPLKVRVKFVDDPQFGPKNEIGGYKPASGAQVGNAQPVYHAPATQPAPQQQAMPWQQQPAAQSPQQQQAPASQPQGEQQSAQPPWAGKAA